MGLMARAVRRIQETAAYLSAVVESSDDAIVTKDLQGVRRLRPPFCNGDGYCDVYAGECAANCPMDCVSGELCQ